MEKMREKTAVAIFFSFADIAKFKQIILLNIT